MFQGRPAIVAFLTRKWEKEHDYRLIKDLWGFDGNRIAVRFQYEWHDGTGQWYRSYGNEQWEFDERSLMRKPRSTISRFMSSRTSEARSGIHNHRNQLCERHRPWCPIDRFRGIDPGVRREDV